jgi:hypothetical protein
MSSPESVRRPSTSVLHPTVVVAASDHEVPSRKFVPCGRDAHADNRTVPLFWLARREKEGGVAA